MKELHHDLGPLVAMHKVEAYVKYICELIATNKENGTLAGADIPERDVDAMLELHKDRIVEIRAAVKDKFESLTAEEDTQYLEIDEWILRYCLSFSKNNEAVDNIIRCIEWRRLPEIQEIAADVVSGAHCDDPVNTNMAKYFQYGMCGTARDGGLVMYFRGGPSANHIFHEITPYEEMIKQGISQREVIAQVQLQVMQKARRIMKFITVVDLDGMSFSDLANGKANKSEGEVSKVSQYAYPQLLQRILIVQPPGFFYYVYNIIKHFFSKKTLEKLEILQTVDDFIKSDLYVNWLDERYVPAFLGGKLPMSECRPSLSGRTMDRALLVKKVHIGARSKKQIVEQYVTPGTVKIEYEFSVPGYGVEVSATAVQGTFDMTTADKYGKVPFTEGDNEARTELLAPIKLKDNQEARIEGVWEVTAPCEIVLTFNNENSRLRSKIANYLLTVSEEEAASAPSGGESPAVNAAMSELNVNKA